MSLDVTNEDTIRAYDSAVKDYFSKSPQVVSAHVKEWLDAALHDLPKDASLLEIGSGTGKDAKYIQSLGYNIKLTDASEGFVKYLNANGFKASKLDIIKQSLDSRYDLILADAVLLHFTENELNIVLKKIHSSLVNGGRFAFTLKQGEGDYIEEAKLGRSRYFHLWTVEGIVPLLKNTGFNLTYNSVAEDNRGNKPAWILAVVEKRETE